MGKSDGCDFGRGKPTRAEQVPRPSKQERFLTLCPKPSVLVKSRPSKPIVSGEPDPLTWRPLARSRIVSELLSD